VFRQLTDERNPRIERPKIKRAALSAKARQAGIPAFRNETDSSAAKKGD